MTELELEISSNERLFITGKTDSGKTFLARHLTRPLPRLVVLDPKFSLGDWGLEEWNQDTRRALREGDEIQVRVVWEQRGSSEAFWDDVMWEVLEAGDVTLYADEIYSLAPQGKWMPEVMQRIWTQGRELGVGGWGSSQRPRWIPPFTVTESEHFFMFRLLKKADRQFMAEFMGDAVVDPIPPIDKHGFYYYNVSWNDPIYVDRLRTGHGDEWGEFDLELEEEMSR